MGAVILAAVYVAVEVVLLGGLAAAALLALAAAVHPCRKADRALADVRAAQNREVPDRIGDELADCDRDDVYDWARAEQEVQS